MEIWLRAATKACLASTRWIIERKCTAWPLFFCLIITNLRFCKQGQGIV